LNVNPTHTSVKFWKNKNKNWVLFEILGLKTSSEKYKNWEWTVGFTSRKCVVCGEHKWKFVFKIFEQCFLETNNWKVFPKFIKNKNKKTIAIYTPR